jgi:hypothetical protein
MSALTKKMNKTEIMNFYVDGLMEEFEGKELNERTVKQIVKAQMEMFEELVEMHIGEKGCPGQFTVPGLFTIKALYRPAVKGGELVRSPASGEMVPRKPKDASVRVKIIPMKKSKDIAMGGITSHKVRARELAKVRAERKVAREAAAVPVAKRTTKKRPSKSVVKDTAAPARRRRTA